MGTAEYSFSDLLRRPKVVTREVEKGDVLLRRRHESDLRLTRADRDAERAAAFAALGRALRHLGEHDPAALGVALHDAFAWMEFLPARDRYKFVDEFSRAIAAAVELDSYAALMQLLREWRTTAEIHADPRLARRLRRPLVADGVRVET